MTEKANFPDLVRKKPKHRGKKRVLFHFVLFTLLGALLIAGGIYGNGKLRAVADAQLDAMRETLLSDTANALVKAAAEANAESNAQRTKISGGLSSKARTVKSTLSAMLSEGAGNEEAITYIVDTLIEAAPSRLTAEDEATAALKAKLTESLASQRESLISQAKTRVEEQVGALKMSDVRQSLNQTEKDYPFMYYANILLIAGAVFLALGLFLGYVQFFAGEDFRKKTADIVEPMDYLLPFFLGVIVFTLYPMVRVFIMAFQERYKLTGEFNGWGLGNFNDVLFGVNTKLPQALGNTFIYVLLTVPISVALSIVIAYLLNQKIKLRALFQTAYFLPMVTSAVAVGMVWKFMFNGDYGIINWLLSLLGRSKIPWLTKPEFSMAVMVIYGIWDSLPMTIILLISGLQNIDEHYYTVAKVDGAKAKRIFFRITVPLLAPTIGLVLIINSISAFKVFNSVVVLFSGTPGPMYNMYTMVYYIYEQINTGLEYGRAAAASLILFGVILVFTMLQRFIQRKWNYV